MPVLAKASSLDAIGACAYTQARRILEVTKPLGIIKSFDRVEYLAQGISFFCRQVVGVAPEESLSDEVVRDRVQNAINRATMDVYPLEPSKSPDRRVDLKSSDKPI